MKSCTTLILAATVSAAIIACPIFSLRAANRDNPAAANNSPSDSECECSLLIQVPRSEIEISDMPARQIDRIDMIVVGTRAVGHSVTSGITNVALDERSTQPTLLITFNGTTAAKTVGRNGPAVIHSHATTSFECRRKVVFDLGRGFVAEPPTVSLRTRLVVDDIATNKPGLRGRLVQRIGWRRSGESEAEANAVVTAKVRRDLTAGFQTSVDKYLADLNRQFSDARNFALATNRDAKLCMALAGEQRDQVVLYLVDAKDQHAKVILPDMQNPTNAKLLWVRKPKTTASLPLPTAITGLLPQNVAPVSGLLAVAPLFNIAMPNAEVANRPAEEKSAQQSDAAIYRTQEDWLIFNMGGQKVLKPTDGERILLAKPVINESNVKQPLAKE